MPKRSTLCCAKHATCQKHDKRQRLYPHPYEISARNTLQKGRLCMLVSLLLSAPGTLQKGNAYVNHDQKHNKNTEIISAQFPRGTTITLQKGRLCMFSSLHLSPITLQKGSERGERPSHPPEGYRSSLLWLFAAVPLSVSFSACSPSPLLLLFLFF